MLLQETIEMHRQTWMWECFLKAELNIERGLYTEHQKYLSLLQDTHYKTSSHKNLSYFETDIGYSTPC